MKSNRYVCIYLILALLSAVLAGCGGGGETNQDVINRFKPQYAELRVKLQQIAQKIPERAAELKAAQALSPQPQYTYGSDAPTNADILMYPHLLDPDKSLVLDKQLDMKWASPLLRGLQYTGEKSPMSATALKNKASEKIASDLEEALKTRYLAVAQVTAYQPVVAVDKNTFKGGSVQVNGYLVDLESQEVLCSFTVSARPQEQISYKYKEGEDPTKALAEWAESSLNGNARAEFIKAINEHCGGDFKLK